MPNRTDERSLVNRVSPVAHPVVVTAPPPDSPNPWLTSRAMIVALVLLGFGLRAATFARDRDLWIDEAMLALNLVTRTPARLTEPLDWNQGAPVGFLMLAKFSVEALSPTERPLRLVPFVGSLLGLVGFAWVAVRLLPRPAAVLGVGLFAVSPFLISYSAECKQYATDAAVAIGLLAASVRMLAGKNLTPGPFPGREGEQTSTPLSPWGRGLGWGPWFALALAGALAVWFSHPAVFVLAGIGTALLAQAAVAKDRGQFLAAGGTIACWVASFAACYVLFLRHLGTNRYLLDYWAGHFLPLPPRELGDLTWLPDHFFAFFAFPGGLGGTEVKAGGIAAVLFLVGLWVLAKECWPVALALVLPAGFALLASGLHQYPFSGRLLLFLVPFMLLGVARGAWAVIIALTPTLPVAAGLLVGVLGTATVLESYQEYRRPARHEQIVPVLDQVRAEWQPGDRVYVYYGAVPAFTFYTQNNPLPADVVCLGTEARTTATAYRDELARLAGSPRVWLIFSHRHKHEESLIRAYAEGLGRCDRTLTAPGAAAYRFDFSARP